MHPVQELRLEGGLHGLHHPRSHIFLGEVEVQNPLTADVAGHDDHRVPEADGATVAVCQPSLIQNLQQDIEQVRVGLLNLVSEEHGVGAAADGFCQVAPLLVAHIAGRGTDEPGHRVLLHELAHVDAHHGLLVVEHELGQGSGEFRLSHSRGPQEDEAADGAVGVLQAGPGPAQGVWDHLQSVIRTDHAAMESLLHVDELFHLTFQKATDRDPGPARHHFGYVFFFYLFFEHFLLSLELSQPGILLLERLLQLRNRAVAQLCRLLEVCLPFRLFGFRAGFLYLPLAFADGGNRIYLHGHGVNLDTKAAGGFVHQVYGLVREEAVAYVTVGEYGRRHQGGVLDAHPVVHFISFFESPQDGDGVFRAWLPDEDGLEATLQSGILLHVLPVLIKGSCADDPQFTTGQHRLQHVGGVPVSYTHLRAHETKANLVCRLLLEKKKKKGKKLERNKSRTSKKKKKKKKK